MIERESVKNIKFLNSGRAIDQKIDLLCEGGPVCAAVAYWGNGLPEDRLPEGSRIICDLNSTGCNPLAIERLFKKGVYEIRYLDHLHAKVVLGAEGAVVSSANFSKNGLGFEEQVHGRNHEAGIFIPQSFDSSALKEIQAWFEELWNKKSKLVTSEVIELAILRYKAQKRRQQKLAEVISSDCTRLERLEASLLMSTITGSHRYRSVNPEVLDRLQIAVEESKQGRSATRAVHGILLAMGHENLKKKPDFPLTLEDVVTDSKGPTHSAQVIEILRQIEQKPELLHKDDSSLHDWIKDAAHSFRRLMEATHR